MMNGWEYVALALGGWTGLGLVGLTVSLARGERRRLARGAAWLAGVWGVYVAVLLGVSLRQPERRLAPGEPVCLHAMCLRVERVEELAGFPARNHVRLLRVTLRVDNGGGSARGEEVKAYLRDDQGRLWRETPGVSGNPLNGRVAAHGSMISEPVFQIAPDATGLELMVTHGRWTWHRLVIGDAESLGHRGRWMELER